MMANEFKLPDLGEGIHEGEVLKVNVDTGEQVEEDEIILEVETDKAAVEIPSPYSDVVTSINVEPGDIVHVGDVMMTFGGVGDNVSREEAEAPEEEEKEEAPKAEREPSRVERGEATGEPHREGPVPAAPSTRRLARELGVDLHEVTPSGPGGRVLAEDVRAHAEGEEAPEEAATEAEEEEEAERARKALIGVSPQTVEVPPMPDFSKQGEVERVPLRSVRRATAKQMALSWELVPHVTTQDMADVTELEKLRSRYKSEVADQDGALTLTVFVIKALVNALKAFPKFNASLDIETEEIVLKKYYNIGIAVDTDRGLLVPVLRDADKKTALELAIDLKATAQRAREGKAELSDMQGGTMTITNVGAIGGTNFSPIINYPEVAILGLAQARIKPVARQVEFEEGQEPEQWEDQYEFVPRLMLPVMLAFDHRVNDGAEAQRFLNHVIDQLENPEKLLLGL
jgi:pyruvate dehydrogenase E2 component (dihydrolipoamide acetyltransferase)